MSYTYIFDVDFDTIYYTDSSASMYAKYIVVYTNEIDFLFVGLTIFVSEERHITLLFPDPQENILNIITRQRRFTVSNFGIRTQFNGNVKDTHTRMFTHKRTPHKHKLIRKKPSTQLTRYELRILERISISIVKQYLSK